MSTQVWKSEMVRARTPDGTLYLTIMKNEDDSIAGFQINIGKAGTPLTAWAMALAEIMTLAVNRGATLEDLLVSLSSITSDGKARTMDTTARSGPEGVWQALLRYRQGWPEEREADRRLIEKGSRGASVAPWARQHE